jgi:hypothetical protein
VPTLTRTGAVDPEIGFTTALPEKAGEPVADAKLSEPVVKMASSADELSAGSEVGAVTPGKPVTPAQFPIGSATVPAADGLVGDVVVVGLEGFVTAVVVCAEEAGLPEVALDPEVAGAGLVSRGLLVDLDVPGAEDCAVEEPVAAGPAAVGPVARGSVDAEPVGTETT